MIGSEKQIKWAEDIKAGKDFEELRIRCNGHPLGIKAIEFVENIRDAKFWIDSRNMTAEQMLAALMGGAGLKVKGSYNSHTAKMAEDGTITVTWKEIVQDGKGGHYATRSESI